MTYPLLRGAAFISGAASGIGKATAVAFAKHGVNKLALADINLEPLEQSINELRKAFPDIEYLALHVDVTKSDEIKAAFKQTVESFGRLDIAVNNAGIAGSSASTHDMDDDEWHRVLDINLNGVYRCQKEELAIMIGQEDLGPRHGRGAIINLASIYGIRAPPGVLKHTAYATAKHGVMGLTKADANAYEHYGIRINAVCPGYVDTPMVQGPLQVPEGRAFIEDHIQRTPIKRLAMADEIADSIVFLASSMGSFVNATGLVVDGGFASN